MGIGFDPERCLYLIQILAPERLTRIVDIGANPINDNPYARLRDLGKCEIWGFEPHPSAFEKLQKAPHPNAHYLPYAVGAGSAEELKICESSGFTSLLEPNVATFEALGQFKKGAAVVARQAVETKALDRIDEIPEFDLLKIDIQGGEVAVFEAGAFKIG
ncbi:FkbM family methyltransferase [Pseudopelagicola sp. nBUS_19]|uniref:FkbM family methyltransferase n=1 Tax=Pseudopelagicola sp. nBUS_19 TaxID=3395316 RepID=UPI003EBF2A1C